MSNITAAAAIYLAPLLAFLSFYAWRRRRHHQRSLYFLGESLAAGLDEPDSLHPVIDHLRCIGCGSCVSACPEHDVLGLIDRKARLVNPADCIGHGACKAACPEDAIRLVFGTATRGVELPEVSPEFQSSAAGIFIAGELGGMGLIRNAIEQGRQAMDSIRKYVSGRQDSADVLDAVVVGAGPAGLSATLRARELNLDTVTIDQDVVGGTVAHFPRGKLVMTAPANLPLVGQVRFSEISKEALMDFWHQVINEHNIAVRGQESLQNITRRADGVLEIETSSARYLSRAVLLAIGRRGTPRKLGVPGEERSKVTYRMTDPAQYAGEKVLVVGGGDSALEAACEIAELGQAEVTLSYRGDAFKRAKPRNRLRVERLESEDRLTVLLGTQVREISDRAVAIRRGDSRIIVPNTVVIVCAGGVLPTPFLKKIGVQVVTKYGTE